ncbi:phosphoribosyl-AMP cyclohydrolase [Acinetobacter ihumii]|uniref:phosphoribosyl-AMP cyclohydrolase n=1 Tax=Acinetobacter ihumii TaxID=2483802 RepID=UPI00102F4DAB|nr:phosphoribosyl-AMP cyclohydrolase [Acinetobacter ihumii]
MVSHSIFLDMEQGDLGQEYLVHTVLESIPWNQEGLIAAIAQDAQSKEVLMLAWVNREALMETLSTRRVCYWSRSRQQLWRKGESSGHIQTLIEARLDCDGDALLLLVQQQGPACHTHRPNCFYIGLDTEQATILTEPMR